MNISSAWQNNQFFICFILVVFFLFFLQLIHFDQSTQTLENAPDLVCHFKCRCMWQQESYRKGSILVQGDSCCSYQRKGYGSTCPVFDQSIILLSSSYASDVNQEWFRELRSKKWWEILERDLDIFGSFKVMVQSWHSPNCQSFKFFKECIICLFSRNSRHDFQIDNLLIVWAKRYHGLIS